MNRVQKRLKKARKLVEKGWAKGNYRIYAPEFEKWDEEHLESVGHKDPGPQVCYCLTGAIMAARMKDPKDMSKPLAEDGVAIDAVLAVTRVVKPSVPHTSGVWRAMATWNDAPDRTHEEVLLAFDEAIALAG